MFSKNKTKNKKVEREEHIVKKQAFLSQHNGSEGIPRVFIITEQLYPLWASEGI